MARDEEMAVLKRMVMDTLATKGVLGRIKADLRAAVFTAVDDEEKRRGVHLENPRAAALSRDDEGAFAAPARATVASHGAPRPAGLLAVSLIADFLSTYDMDTTRGVFMPQACTVRAAKRPRGHCGVAAPVSRPVAA